jgi:hypothetical protein
MGLLVRKFDDVWLVELRETWYFMPRDVLYDEFVRLALKYRLSYAVAVAPNDLYSVSLQNVVVRCSSVDELRLVFARLLELKVLRGDAAAVLSLSQGVVEKVVKKKVVKKKVVKKKVVGKRRGGG